MKTNKIVEAIIDIDGVKINYVKVEENSVSSKCWNTDLFISMISM